MTRHPMDNVETLEMIQKELEKYAKEDHVLIQLGRWRDSITAMIQSMDDRYQNGYREIIGRLDALELYNNSDPNEASQFWFNQADRFKQLYSEHLKRYNALNNRCKMLEKLLAEKGIHVCL